MSPPASQPPALRLVRGHTLPEGEFERAWFCGYCGVPARAEALILPHARVCTNCALGLMLEARRDLLPAATDAFLVVDSRLLVQAVSRRAEAVLQISEGSWVGQPVGELLDPAAAEADGAPRLGELVLEAVAADDCRRTFVRPKRMFGVRMRARVGSCGPPRAGLLVLEAGGGPAALRAL